MANTKTEAKAQPFNYHMQVKTIRQGFADTFAAIRLLAAADKIEKAEQSRLQRRA